MISLVRKVVAGPKNTTAYQGQHLDLTYITDRVIAMAYPASDMLEKTYRNNIQDVADYLEEKHKGHYLIINVSSRIYDYSLFGNKVKDYQWPDHQTPPFSTLIQAAYDMYSHLSSNNKNVVAVHCNHGKGRTGTAIISLFLLINFFKSSKECLQFYNSKRFNKQTYGVDQPCQVRYLSFIQRVLAQPKISQKLICYRLKGITHKGLNEEDYYINISSTRTGEMIHEKMRLGRRAKEGTKILLGDLFLEIFEQKWAKNSRIARINYNMYFLQGGTKLKLRGDQIKLSSGHSADFEITFYFQFYCLCHLPMYEGSSCHCKRQRLIQENHWAEMTRQVNECKSITKTQSSQLLFAGKNRSPEPFTLDSGLMKHYMSMDSKQFRNKRQEKIYNQVQAQQQRTVMGIVDDYKLEPLSAKLSSDIYTTADEKQKLQVKQWSSQEVRRLKFR